jgi:hypothetical protein
MPGIFFIVQNYFFKTINKAKDMPGTSGTGVVGRQAFGTFGKSKKKVISDE